MESEPMLTPEKNPLNTRDIAESADEEEAYDFDLWSSVSISLIYW